MGRLSFNLILHHVKRQSRRCSGQKRDCENLMEDEEIQVSKKMKLDDIELKKLIDDDDDDDSDAPQELEVVPDAVNVEGLRMEFMGTSDLQLEERIRKYKGHLSNMTLADNGEKLRVSMKKMEAELERRKREKEACSRKNSPQSKDLNLSGAAAGVSKETSLCNGKTHSSFYSVFNEKLEQDNVKATRSCNQPKRTSNGQSVSKREQTSRDMSYPCSTRLTSNKISHTTVNSDGRGNLSSFLTSLRSLPSRLIEKADAPKYMNSVRARGRQQTTIVLDDEDSQLDEDDSPSVKNLQFDDMQHQLENLEDSFKGSKISYPSRDDPTHVDIDFHDIKCLDPEVYLSSPIMNFYMRYLQQPDSPTATPRCDYHFFNTFFYSKLKAAVSYKGNDSTSFTKFRRWWKGINIFHKAYILIPVHEDHHWSLIIICIPHKDEETGPIILHLDSLELHYSRPIFENIKRFIKVEWEYLTQEGASSDLPWHNLPRRMEEKSVMVPQQKNEYDCGLFVLYFMERFIAEAPERLSRKHLQMFNRQWFRPAQASALRTKIRSLLIKEFKAAQQLQNDVNAESVQTREDSTALQL